MATATKASSQSSRLPPLFSSRREREVFRYAEAVLDVHPYQSGHIAASSRDPALTAYAQLVALRLNAKRALISLIDDNNHYFLAEATQTLSLQADNVHGADDGLYLGATVVPRKGDFFCQTLNQWSEVRANAEISALLVVPDLQHDERFAQFDMVADGSHASYAGIPLIAPSGYAIGALSFLDDKPRPGGLTEDQSTFLRDVATTVVAHLELARTSKALGRGLSMAKGLGRFIEGKESVDDSAQEPYQNLRDMQDRQAVQSARLGASDRTRALNTTTNTERVDDELRKHLGSSAGLPDSTAYGQMHDNMHHRSDSGDKPSAKPQIPAGQPGPSHSRRHNQKNETTGDIQEDLLSKNVRVSFERAARIITEALDLSGTVFLDGSVGEFGKLYSTEGSSSTQYTSDTSMSAASDRESGRESASSPAIPKNESTKPCRLLASAYSMSETPGSTLHRGVPETFLKTLMRHYPYGKVWNFDQDGNASSGSESASKSDAKAAAAIGDNRKRRKRSDHGRVLQELFPGARSLGLMPMWDSQRQRFFAGAIVWSYKRTRVLSFQEDMNYLGAFCDVIMAEVARLDAQREAETKKSFLSSISHELKTPLHGILGAVECLQDKENIALQDEMLHMIDASARSVLDIINNLLAHADSRSSPLKETIKYSNPRAIERAPRLLGAQRGRKHRTSPEGSPVDLAALTEEVLDIALWSTPQPSPMPGFSESSSSHLGKSSKSPLKVILDIDDSTTSWEFFVNAGAWRRILLNLTSNSIKYTDRGGFLKLTLASHPPDPADTSERSMVELVCVDSGRGMSQQFQSQGMWQAFSQEDSHSQGTGLGLSLVRGIVHDMEGSVEIKSTKDVGTEVRIKVPLFRGPPVADASSDVTATTMRDWWTDSTYTLLGFDGVQDGDDREAEASRALRQSLERVCDSFGLRATGSTSRARVCVVSEQKATGLITRGHISELESHAATNPVIVLCHSVVSARDLTLTALGKLPLVKAVSQPCGPRKLLRALSECGTSAFLPPTDISISPGSQGEDLEISKVTVPAFESNDATPQAPVYYDDLQSASASTSTKSPAEEHQPHSQNSDAMVMDTPSSPKLSVLIVDDNSLNLRLLETFLKKLGYEYLTATNGLESVQAFKEAYQKSKGSRPPPMLILMDATMPVMDGFEATRQIRGYERAMGIEPSTIIALTAMNTAEARQEAFSSGMDTFMTKPVRLKDIKVILAEHQERY